VGAIVNLFTPPSQTKQSWSEDMFEEARKLFADFCKDGGDKTSRVTQVGAVCGNNIRVSNNHACHAGLLGLNGKYGGGYPLIPLTKPLKFNEDVELKIVLSYVQKYYAKEEDMILFADWMVNESPWASAFLNPSGKDVMSDRVWVLETKIPGNMMGGACIATRLPSEFPRCFAVWVRLAKLGVNKTLAYLVASQTNGNIEHTYPVQFVQPGGHTPIPDYLGRKWAKNFLSQNPVNPTNQYATHCSYGSVDYMWGSDGHELQGKLATIKPKSLTVGVNHNIFQQNAKGTWKFSNDDDLVDMALTIEKMVN